MDEVGRWKAVSAVAVCLLLIVSGLYAFNAMSDDKGHGYVDPDMSLWVDGSESKEAFVSYLKAVTDEKSKDFIPVEDRIAVFDMDGTLICERDTHYFDLSMMIYRILEDPDYKDKASEFERQVALDQQAAPSPGVLDDRLETARAMAFKGLTLEEMDKYVKDFAKNPSPGYIGMLRGDAFFKPMLQMVDALQENDFTVYVISGTDRLTVRALLDNSPIQLPNDQIKGSDKLLVATGQDKDGSKYVYQEDDEIIYGGEHVIKTLNFNKIVSIVQEIGKQPVLAFGNSSSDSSMANYALFDNKYKAMAFMLCCDDLEREYGNMDAANKMYKLCEENDWVPISMKQNDWTTIYGDGVKKK